MVGECWGGGGAKNVLSPVFAYLLGVGQRNFASQKGGVKKLCRVDNHLMSIFSNTKGNSSVHKTLAKGWTIRFLMGGLGGGGGGGGGCANPKKNIEHVLVV